MKITLYRKDGKTQTQRTLELIAALEAMKTEIKARPVSTLREMLAYASPNSKTVYAQKIPLYAFGGVFHQRDGQQKMVQYNGCVLLEVNNLANHKEATQVRNDVARLPQTLVAFIGSSNKTVKIVVPFTLPEGGLPQEHRLAEFFHAKAYRDAVQWYQPQLRREIMLKKPTLDHCCRMSYDPNLYYNPEAVPIRISQPMNMPVETTYQEKRDMQSNPLQRLLPGLERSNAIALLYSTSMENALREINHIDWEGDMVPFCIKLAENCFRSGIPEEDAIRWSILYSRIRPHLNVLRTSFRNVYSMENRANLFGNNPCIPSGTALIIQMEEFMQRRYQLRRNVLKNQVEYREVMSFYFDFRSVNKQAMNSICMNAISEGLPSWDVDIKRYLESDRVPAYNPIEDFLYSTGTWDGKDRIGELARRIKCDNPKWPALFHTWFLGMVAGWQQLSKQHANSVLPLLVGDQGCGKSTFCLNLLPPELREYYTDSIDFSKRSQAEQALSRFALINMDEFDSISASYQGFLKHVLQKTVIQTRLPYAGSTERMPRYATFIATSNNFDLLTDPTGSRRFICIEVEGRIDYSSAIDYKQVYAQAIEELRCKKPCWFTPKEEAYITRCNQKFQRMLPEEETIYSYFRVPVNTELFEELTCSEMLERIQRKHSGFRCSTTTAMKLGRSLKNHFSNRRLRQGTVYKVVEIKR